MTPEELLRAAMNAERAGDLQARDGLVKAAEAMMANGGQQAAPAPKYREQMLPQPQLPPRAGTPVTPTRQVDTFGDTTIKAMAGPAAATRAYATGLIDQSRSPTMAALPDTYPAPLRRMTAGLGDLAMVGLAGLGTGFAGAAGLIGEAVGGTPTQERKLARDLMMMGQVAAPELAGVSGAALAGATSRTASAAPRALKPSERAAQAAQRVGVTPSLGMTGKTGAMTAAALEKVPFSGGTVARDAARAVGEVESAFAGAVSRIGPAGGPVRAGDALQTGLKGFVDSFQRRSGELFDAVDNAIPPGTQTRIPQTAQVVADQKRYFAQNPELAARLGLNQWDAVVSEAQTNGLPWQALKQFRSKVGEAIGSNRGALADEDLGRLKQLYGALTADMEVAARTAGPEAFKAWRRANDYYRSGAQRIETYLDKTITASSPERAYEAFVAMTKADRATSDVTRMRRIKASLKREDWQVVSSSIVDRLGKARPGQQGADGDTFSAGTFLTEWNKLSPEAKDILVPSDVRRELDDLAVVAETVKEGGAERNLSNTGTVVTATGLAYGLQAAPVSTTLALTSANISARALTSQTFLTALRNYRAGKPKMMEAMARGTGAFSADAKAFLGVAAANQTDAPQRPAVRAIP
jgi:hypothetical protein